MENSENPSIDNLLDAEGSSIIKDNLEPGLDVTELTKEQKEQIIQLWNSRPEDPPSLKEFAEMCFGGGVDGRDKRAKLIKAFLATHKLKAPVSYIYQRKSEILLTEEQKELIANKVSSHNALEISEIIFDKKLNNLSHEVRTVSNYIRTLTGRTKYADPKDLITERYKAPQIESSMIDRINKYVDNPIDKMKYEKNEREKLAVRALIGYVNNFRFLQQINTYSTTEDRELFESGFITYIYGKHDLEPEEHSQYIILCAEAVIDKNILERIEQYQAMADEAIHSEDGEQRRMSMSFVEMISSLRKEHNDCVKRQQSLMNDLNGKRSGRLKEKIQQNQSLLNLVEFWKNQEKREQLLELAAKRKEKLKVEVERVSSLDDLIIQIWGLPKDIVDL